MMLAGKGGLRIVGMLLIAAVAGRTKTDAGAGANPVPELVMLPSGAVIEATPPAGWTHLIVKSLPSLKSGDLGTLPASARKTATLFRTAIVAEVRTPARASEGFQIARLGLGLCVPFEGLDTVVESSIASKARDSLGFVELQVLARAEQELRKGRLIVRTPTFLIFAGPSTLLLGSTHESVNLFYAVLVDPALGHLSTLLWSLPAEGWAHVGPKSLVLLPSSLVFHCGIDVDAERILGTVPYSWSFAMKALPEGTQIRVPEALQTILRDPKRMATDPAGLEARLRSLVARRGE
jgi:hypothetical protein